MDQVGKSADAAAPIVGFHTAGSKSRIHVEDRQLQKAEAIIIADLNYGPSRHPSLPAAAPVVGFHTAGSNSRIHVEDHQLQQAEQLLQTSTRDQVANQSVPAAAPVVAFHTAGSKSRIQVDDQQLQKAEQLLLQSSDVDQVVHHSVPAAAPVVGFHTAGSKSRIQVDAQQLQKAEQLLLQTSDVDQGACLPAAAPVVGFHTAGSKSRIQVDDQQLQKAEQLLQTSTRDQVVNPSLPAAAPVVGFHMTGSKSRIQVDDQQLQKAEHLLLQRTSTMDQVASVPAGAPIVGFHTAGSNSRIQVNDQQLQKAEQLLLQTSDVDEVAKQSVPAAAPVAPVVGFHTAGSKSRIQVDAQQLQKAEQLLLQTLDVDEVAKQSVPAAASVAPVVGFHTAGSKSKIQVDAQQLQKAEQLLLQTLDVDEVAKQSVPAAASVAPVVGFHTAGSKSKIQVDDRHLQKAEQLLQTTTPDADSTSPDSAARIGFRTAESKSVLQVDVRQLQQATRLLKSSKEEEENMRSVPAAAATAGLSIGFQTAGSKSRIQIDDRQLEAAQLLLNGDKSDEFEHQEKSAALSNMANVQPSLSGLQTAGIGFLSPESNLEVCVSEIGMKRTRSPSTDPDASPDAELQQLLEQGDTRRSKGASLSAHTTPKAAFVASPKSLLKRKSCEDGTRPNTKRRVSFQPSPDPYRSQLPQTPSLEVYGSHLSRRGISFAGECEGAREARSQLCGGTLAAVTPAQKMQFIREGSITDSECKFPVTSDHRVVTPHTSLGKGDDDLECNTQNLESRFECKGETQSAIFEEKVSGNFSHLRSIPEVTPVRKSVGAREKDSVVRPMGETSGSPDFGPEHCATSVADINDANRLPKCTTLAEAFKIGAVHGDSEFWSNCGVNETTRHISSQNAGDVVFDTLSGLPCGFYSTAVEGTIGYLNDLRTELSERGCEPNKLQDAWLANHKRWIIWKLASYERSFCDFLGGKYLILDRLIESLAKRYQIEIVNGKRPAIRIILNGDAAASLPMILCVSRLFRGSDGGSQELPNKNSDASAKLRLTDGWYEIDAEIDSPLCSLVANEVIRVGTKLLVTNAALRGAEQGVDPLDPEYQMTRPHLFLTTNSTRLAKWNSKLGFLRTPKGDMGTKFGVVKRISDVVAGGGDVPLLKMLVLRRFPKMYMEKRTAGNEILSEAEEDDRRNSFERRRMLAIEKLTDRVSKDIEKEIDEEAPEIWKKHASDFGDSEVVHDQDRAALTAWMDKRRVLLQRRIQEEVEAELETDLSLLRKSIPFIRVLVHSAVIDKLKGRASERAILTIWDPTEDQINILKEGRLVDVQDIGTRSSAYDGYKQLTSSGRSSMRAIEDPARLIDIHEAGALETRQPFDMIRCHISAHEMVTVGDQDTFDIAGVSVSPMKPVRDDQKGFELYLTDGSQLLLRVYFEKVPYELSRAHGDFRTIAFNDLQMLPFDDVNNCAVARYSSMSSVSKASVACLKRLENYKRESMCVLNRVAAYVEARMPLRESCKAGTLIGTIVGMNLEDSRGEMLSINVDSFQSMEKVLLPTYFLETIREAVETNSASLAEAEESRLEYMKTLGFLFRAHGVLWRIDFARISNGQSESLIVRNLEKADIERLIRLHASWR